MLLVIKILLLLFFLAGASYPLWLPRRVYWFAERNLFVTTIEPGLVKVVLTFGEPYRLLMERGWYCTRAWRLTQIARESRREPRWPLWIEKNFLPGGLRWVGLPYLHSVYSYNFRWQDFRDSEPQASEDGHVEHHKLENLGKWVISFSKTIDYIYTRDTLYYDELLATETHELMPVTIRMLLTIRIVNPFLALFKVKHWLSAVLEAVKPAIRHWVQANDFNRVIEKAEALGRNADVILSLPCGEDNQPNMPLYEYFETRYGVRVKRIQFVSVDAPKDYSDAATERAAAVQKKQTKITGAEAEREYETIVAAGEASRIDQVTRALQEGGAFAMRLRQLEALEKVSEGDNLIITGGGANVLVDRARRNDRNEPRQVQPGQPGPPPRPPARRPGRPGRRR